MTGQDRPAELHFELTPNDHPRSDEERAALLANPGFGKVFTDHLALATWTTEAGWHDAQVRAYGPLSLMPAAAVLHYACLLYTSRCV